MRGLSIALGLTALTAATTLSTARAAYTSQVFNADYTYVFRGTENDSWATVGNWYTTSDNGATWVQHTGAVPGVPNSNLWDAVLLDGDLMTINKGADGYKTITMEGMLEGWNTPIGVANGVHLKIKSIKKLQGGNLVWRVDERSKLTVTTYGGNGNTETTHDFYIDAPEGITFENAFSGSNGTPDISCHFGKRGSIKFVQGTGGGSYSVASVALDCGGGGTQKCVLSRTLIAYASKTATMTVNAATVSGSYQDGPAVTCSSKGSTPTTDDPVGTYQLTVGDTGVVITYVATEAMAEGSLLLKYSRAASVPVQANSTVALALTTAELASGRVTFTSPNATMPTGVTWLLSHAGTALSVTPTAIFAAAEDGQSGTWTLTFTHPEGYGAIELDISGARIPAAAKTVQPTGDTAFGKSNNYQAVSADGTYWQAAKVTGATNRPMIFGGLGYSENGPIDRNLLLTVTGGDFNHIYGGHNADDYNNNRTRTLNGDTRVEMSDGTVNYLFGGNYKDGYATPVTLGDIDVVVSGDAKVYGSIFGGSVTAHNRGWNFGSATQSQRITVKVKNMQTTTTSALADLALKPGYIAGGDTYMSNDSPTCTIYGNTAVVIDLPENASGTFDKSLVGGSVLLDGGSNRVNPALTVRGNSSVTINAPNTVIFSQTVMGGPAFGGSGGSATTSGDAAVTIRGGTYTGAIYAGGSGASATVSGNATLTLASGDFSAATIAPCGPGSTVSGTSTLAIADNVDLSSTTISPFSTMTLAAGKTLTLGEKRLSGMPLAAGESDEWATLAVTLTAAEADAGSAELCAYRGERLPAVRVTLPNGADASAWSAKVIHNKLFLSTGSKPMTWNNGAASWAEGVPGFNPGDSVIFGTTTGSEAKRVEIPTGVIANEMTVQGNYTFALGDFGEGLTATKIAVAGSAKATFVPQAVRYVRLQLDNANGGTGDNGVPGVSELILMKDGEAVAWPRGTTIKQVNPDGSTTEPDWSSSGNEKVNALIDGVWNGSGNSLNYTNPADNSPGTSGTYSGNYVTVANNKWWPRGNPKAYAVIALGEALDFDGYKLMTTDWAERSAKDWVLEVSADGKTWAVADSRTNWTVPGTNSFYVYESGNTIFPVAAPVTAINAPIEVESNGTLGGTAKIAGNVTFAMMATLDATAEQPLEITGTVTVTGTEESVGYILVNLPSDVALWPVLKTPTEGLEANLWALGSEFLYREGTYWAVRTAAKALTAEVTAAEALSNLVWLGTDSKTVAREEVLKLWAFGLADATATLNTTTAATVAIDCPEVPALKLEGSAAVTLAKDNDVTPAIASLTVSADSTVAAKLLQCVTGSATVAEGKTLSLTGTNVSLSKLPSGTGAVKIPTGSSVTYTAGNGAYSGRTTVEGSLTLACTLDFTQASGTNPTYPIDIAQGGTVTLAQNASTYRSFRGKGDLVVTGTNAVLGIPRDASVVGGFDVTGNVTVEAGKTLTVTNWSSADSTFGGASFAIEGTLAFSLQGVNNGVTAQVSLGIAAGKSLSGTGEVTGAMVFENGAVIKASTDGAVTCEGTVKLPKTGAVTVKATAYGAKVLKKSGLDVTKFAVPTVAGDDNWKTEGLFTEKEGTLYLVAKPTFTPPEGSSEMSASTARAIAELAAAKGNYGITTVAVQDKRVPEAVEVFTEVMTVNGDTATIAYDFGVSDLTISTLRAAVAGGRLTVGTRYVLVCATVSNHSDQAQNTASYATDTTLTLLNDRTPIDGVVEPTEAEIAALRLTTPATGSRWLAVPMGTLFPEEHKTGTMKLTVKASK